MDRKTIFVPNNRSRREKGPKGHKLKDTQTHKLLII